MYQFEFHPKFDKDLSKLDKNIRRDIRDKYIPEILKSPYKAGKALKGKLAGLRSYTFIAHRIEYRIIYDIVEETALILFLMVGTRENIYNKLLRRIK